MENKQESLSGGAPPSGVKKVPELIGDKNPGTSMNALKRVLIVDDDRNLLEMLERMLSFLGWTVHKAGSGEEALEILSRDSFNVIITDLQMPGMDGLSLAARIKQARLHSGVILMTGLAEVELRDRLKKEPYADTVIHKPFRLANLSNVVESAWKKHSRKRRPQSLQPALFRVGA